MCMLLSPFFNILTLNSSSVHGFCGKPVIIFRLHFSSIDPNIFARYLFIVVALNLLLSSMIMRFSSLELWFLSWCLVLRQLNYLGVSCYHPIFGLIAIIQVTKKIFLKVHLFQIVCCCYCYQSQSPKVPAILSLLPLCHHATIVMRTSVPRMVSIRMYLPLLHAAAYNYLNNWWFW